MDVRASRCCFANCSNWCQTPSRFFFFFLNNPAPPEISPLPLRAPLPISHRRGEEPPPIPPPLAEFAYRLIETVPGYKRVSTILDLASAGLLMLLLAAMKQPLHRVLAYAWNPAVLTSFAMSGHFDSLAIVTLLAALFFLVTNRPALSMAALALSFLSKFFPVLLLLTFLKRVRLAHVGIFVALVFACYVPFLGAGGHLFDGAGNYARDWVNNSSLVSRPQFVAGCPAGAEPFSGLMCGAPVGALA